MKSSASTIPLYNNDKTSNVHINNVRLKVITFKAYLSIVRIQPFKMIGRVHFVKWMHQTKSMHMRSAVRYSSDTPSNTPMATDDFLKYGMCKSSADFEVMNF